MSAEDQELTVGEFVTYLQEKSPASVVHDGMVFRYIGTVDLDDLPTC
jgi:hypothetical protein